MRWRCTPRPASRRSRRAHVYRPFVVAYLIAVVVVFWLFWPILTAGRITDLHLRTIVWFRRVDLTR